MRQFRTLKASEIECRIATSTDKGASLLLYKTARTDYQLFDEIYGAMNWQCKYELINGVMYCGIGVKNAETGEWVWKWNAGTESNTEAEKGQASDALKRAGFAWGCGTELYSAPFIWIPAAKLQYNAKNKPINTFCVSAISYNNDEDIDGLVIVDERSGEVVYQWGQIHDRKQEAPVCEHCNKPILPYEWKGKYITSNQQAKLSKDRLGKCLCRNCATLYRS